MHYFKWQFAGHLFSSVYMPKIFMSKQWIHTLSCRAFLYVDSTVLYICTSSYRHLRTASFRSLQEDVYPLMLSNNLKKHGNLKLVITNRTVIKTTLIFSVTSTKTKNRRINKLQQLMSIYPVALILRISVKQEI